jgi:hypothetical protein
LETSVGSEFVSVSACQLEKYRGRSERGDCRHPRLSDDALMERITVQGCDITKLEAVYHVVEHFSGHAFQIIFATELLTGADLGFCATFRREVSEHA